MAEFELTENEVERIRELMSFKILDTPPELAFDAIAKLASQICGMPISMISLVDKSRYWFKSVQGLDFNESPRDDSFCSMAIKDPNSVYVIEDTHKDPLAAKSPKSMGESGIRFYAGAPLVTSEGFAIGALCVMDTKPRKLNRDELDGLQLLALQVIEILELRRNALVSQQRILELTKANEELSRFAHLVSHDLKSPLSSMVKLAELISDENKGTLGKYSEASLGMLVDKGQQAYKLVDGILQHTITGQKTYTPESIDLLVFVDQVVQFCSAPADIHILVDVTVPEAYIDKTLLHQILQNLISNAIKYNDKPSGLVKVNCYRENDELVIEVIDNGPGIPAKDQEVIYTMFKTLHRKDRFGNKGTGIGLSTIKRIVELMSAQIECISNSNEGTTFRLRFFHVLH